VIRRGGEFLGVLAIAMLFIASFGGNAVADTGDQPGNWRLTLREPLVIWAEPQDEGYANELADLLGVKIPDFVDKLGVQMPDSVRILIAPNRGRFRYLTRGLPDWTGGAAYPAQRTIVLQSPTLYENKGQFTVTALHEVVHILTDHRGPSRLPRWLSEGLAMYLSGETMYKNRTPLGRAVVTGRTYTLDGIEEMMRFGPEQAQVAYLQSINFVEFLIDRYGWPFMAELIEGYRTGEDPDQIFERATGRPLFDVEVAWHSSLRDHYRWYRLFEWINFDMFLWVSASLLVVVSGGLAIIRRRRYLSSQEEGEGADVYPLYLDEEPPDGEELIDDNQIWR